jgi:protein-L-isoaspartate(D-aspartate) O-methyltransferase
MSHHQKAHGMQRRRVRWEDASVLLAMLLMGIFGFRNAGAEGSERARERMVKEQIEARGIRDPRVLAAMRAVPRHEFVPEDARADAYEDHPLPIGYLQTISQPYIVAAMAELAEIGPEEKVLEVGTGCGYAAAVFAQLAAEVYTIEIVEELAKRARDNLARTGAEGVQVRAGDGYRGWPEAAPFDAILVAASAPRVPEALIEQLAPGGRIVMPVGDWDQYLELHVKTEKGVKVERVFPVRFVPMTGEIREK